jgi:RNA polymerase sigma-70 factor, ECF subfamily
MATSEQTGDEIWVSGLPLGESIVAAQQRERKSRVTGVHPARWTLVAMPEKRRSSKPPSTRITLLARLRHEGDAEAWGTFVDLYTPLVFRYCRGRHLQDADARDIAQQVLAIVYRNIGKFEYDREKGRFRNWLGAVTAHEISRYQRKERRTGRGVGNRGGDDLAALATAAADPAWIEEFNSYIFQLALARIRPDFEPEVWQAFDLTWLHDVQPRDAAAQIGKPSAWIYKARYKVVERLRKELEYLTSDAAVLQKPT